MPRYLLPTIFSSIARTTTATATATPSPTRWTLLRTLKSENPNDIQGELHGTASFTPLHSPSLNTNTITHATTDATKNPEERYTDLLYSEEGSLPALPILNIGPGLRWTKKYIWRLSAEGGISVWFVKVDKSSTEEEADYLFHEFDLITNNDTNPNTDKDTDSGGNEFVTPPVPPEVIQGEKTKIIAARGNHLCINDMYRTAYAFRVDEENGEVLSWASRHVVRGPKKGQDIVNLYSKGS
ncbi:hypothetical protein BDW59DRAFT_176075 [Aspergillus cavernicola]|uniref:DUF6314 domain-containing protein n=1 Tax=Aspergillus cavernicola TaxID=176166 RepID=A0ABR4HJJ4_9EURO